VSHAVAVKLGGQRLRQYYLTKHPFNVDLSLLLPFGTIILPHCNLLYPIDLSLQIVIIDLRGPSRCDGFTADYLVGPGD